MQDGSSRDGNYDQEEARWGDFLRSELDSWHPTQLPLRFHPRQPKRRLAIGPALRLAVLAVVLALLAALALTSLPRQISDALVSLSRARSTPSPTSLTDSTPRGSRRAEAPSRPPRPAVSTDGPAPAPEGDEPAGTAGGVTSPPPPGTP